MRNYLIVEPVKFLKNRPSFLEGSNLWYKGSSFLPDNPLWELEFEYKVIGWPKHNRKAMTKGTQAFCSFNHDYVIAKVPLGRGQGPLLGQGAKMCIKQRKKCINTTLALHRANYG